MAEKVFYKDGKPLYYEKTSIFRFPLHGYIKVTVHMDKYKYFENAWMWIHNMIDNMKHYFE